MLGVIVNSLTIIVCAAMGLFIKGADKIRNSIMTAMGLAVFFLGISGGVRGLTNERANTLLFIISLVIGTLIGETLDLDGKFIKFGELLGKKFGGGGVFAKGFVTGSFMYCVGAMAIIGSLESGLMGKHTVIFTKSVLDGVTSIILSSALGPGVIFSGFSVFVYQGVWTILAGFLSPLITDDSIRELSTVGNVLITAIGLDLLDIKKIKYANMLPSIFVPIIFYIPTTQSIIRSILNLF